MEAVFAFANYRQGLRKGWKRYIIKIIIGYFQPFLKSVDDMEQNKMNQPIRERSYREKILDRLLLWGGIVFLCIFCITGYFLLRYYDEYRNTKKLDEQIASLRYSAGNEKNGGWDNGGAEQADTSGEEGLCRINPDYIGWLVIPDAAVDYPVVQRDNSYYLSHDFTGEENRHGAIFLDENCSLEDDVLLIHGHHMKDGTMFGGLKNYKKEAFRQGHGIIYLDKGEGDEAYEVFAAALIDLTREGYFDYQRLPVRGEEKAAYLEKLKENAFWYDNEENPEGQILLLSTCEYGSSDQRLVIAAVYRE